MNLKTPSKNRFLEQSPELQNKSENDLPRQRILNTTGREKKLESMILLINDRRGNQRLREHPRYQELGLSTSLLR